MRYAIDKKDWELVMMILEDVLGDMSAPERCWIDDPIYFVRDCWEGHLARAHAIIEDLEVVA